MKQLTAGKRKVLIIEDNQLNRDILSTLLEEDFDVLTAENGEVGLRVMSEHYSELSLVFLDVYMPVCNGFEFLTKVSADGLLNTVPIIVTTGSNNVEDEARCLDLGAADFVTKPYNPRVVKGRAHSVIKLKESVATLNAVEFDNLTGCYTMPAFYHHVSEMMKKAEFDSFDIFASDVIDFKLVNSVYGEKMGDYILTLLTSLYYKNQPNGIVARHGDQIYTFYPSKDRLCADITRKLLQQTIEKAQLKNLVIKCGLYANVDKSLPVTAICDRVMLAVDSIKGNPAVDIAVYNDELGNKSIRKQKMKASFEKAIKREEFKVWFQPKVDVSSEKVVAAEALVRWIDSKGNITNPGEFIPLFEKDGLIHKLDEYVFKKVCEYQKSRIDKGMKTVPISVNLSRNTAFHDTTIEILNKIVSDYNIPKYLIPIELTESAAEEETKVKSFAKEVTDSGFLLHIDDFGAGYSSFANLGSIPFDELKIDKSIIDMIGTNRGGIILNHIIGIAQDLGMKVVAEGVEEKNQVDFLKEAGCEIIQGFYFFKPQTQKDFSNLLNETVTA